MYLRPVPKTSNLILYDFSQKEFLNLTKGIDAFHPDISPDGKWVAFCTGYESQDGRSEMFVLNLETGLMKQLDAYSAVIPRWRILENGDTAIVYIDQAGLSQKPVWRSYGTWMVTFKNEKFGKPKKIFSGAFSSTSNDFKFP